MADRSIVVKLGLNVAGLVAGARTGAKALSDMGGKGLDWTSKHEQSLNRVTTGIGAIGLAAVAGAALAVRAYANFDQAMSHVAATGEDARGSMDALRQAALDAGAQTAFSATEAAGAIEELAKAGVSAEDILAGGLDGALDLAAAGGIEVAQAAEIAASAMTQFGLKGDDVVHVADLLAAAAGKAQGGVHEMGMALAQAGLVADQTGLSIEETTGGLAAFASAGLLGSDAGTSMKTMLQRLTPTSKEAADKMAELGISAYDSQGNFIGLAEFAGVLRGALVKLTPEQRNAAMATIFGSDAVRAASIIYEQGEGGIRDWIAAVDDQGFAAETAAERMDNLKGDLEEFMGALETALIGAGEGADGPLRDLVQGATDVVNKFNELPDGAKTALLAIVGGGGLVALGVAGLGKLVIGVANTREALSDMGVTADRAGKAVKVALGAAAVIGLAISLRQVVNDLAESFQDGAVGAGEMELALQQLERGEVARVMADLTTKFADMKQETGGEWLRDSLLGPFSEGKKEAEEFANQMEVVDGILSGMVGSGDIQGAADMVADLGRQFGLSGDELAQFVTEYLPQYQDGLKASEAAALEAGKASGQLGETQRQVGEDFDTATEGVQSYTEALAGMVEQLQAAGLLALSTRDAQRNLEQAIDDATVALDENGASLDITTEKGRANQTALDDIASSTHDLIGAMADQGAEEADLQAVMTSSREQFIATARQMGLNETQAAELADRLGLIPGNYTAIVTAPGATEARRETDKAIGRMGVFGKTNVIAHLRAQANTRDAAGALSALTRARTVNIYPKIVGSLPKRAKGGPVQLGQAYEVGEQGPELFVPNSDGTIIPAGRTRTILSSLNRRSGLESMGALTALGVAEYRLGEGLWNALDSATSMVEDGGEGVEESLTGLAAAIDKASDAYERVARAAVPAPTGLAKPDRPNGKQPLNLTQMFARDLLAAVKAGKRVHEDFSWAGMSDKWTDDIRSVLWEMFYAGGRDYPGTKPIADWVGDWLGGGGGKAKGGSALWNGPGRRPEPIQWMTNVPLTGGSAAHARIDPAAIADAVSRAMPSLDGATLQLQIGSEAVLARVVDRGARVNARRS
jgi:TP901 family phage tail tape measure protein